MRRCIVRRRAHDLPCKLTLLLTVTRIFMATVILWYNGHVFLSCISLNVIVLTSTWSALGRSGRGHLQASSRPGENAISRGVWSAAWNLRCSCTNGVCVGAENEERRRNPNINMDSSCTFRWV